MQTAKPTTPALYPGTPGRARREEFSDETSWMQRDEELTGSMLSTRKQWYGLSRDERRGRWLFYARRDDRHYEGRDGSVNTETTPFASTTELAEYLVNEEPIYDAEELVERVSRWAAPAMTELAEAVRGLAGSRSQR